MAAALTISSTGAQRLIFIPTHEHPQRQMMTSFSSLNNGNNEPPCRTRRLEPWRQQVREHCRADATTNCRHNIEKEERRATTTSQNSFEDEINNFFDSIFSPPASSIQQQQMNNNIEDPFDSLVRSMLGFSLNAFDQIMAEATSQQPSTIQLIRGEGRDEVNEEGVDNYPNEEDVDVGEENYPDVDGEDWDQFDEEQEGFEEVGVGKVSQEDKEDSESSASEDAAVTTMDALVANLAHRSIHRTAAELEEEGAGAQEDITSLFLDNLPKKLFEMGNNILAETTHSRRRLMEGEGKIDPHLQVKERLGKKLSFFLYYFVHMICS